jgi:P2 family phage contractile tail tube protein
MGAPASDVRKNSNLFVDGRGYAGNIAELNPPKLALKTEEFRAGGMDGPIKLRMGMEAMDADFSLNQFSKDVLAMFGMAAGNTVPLTIRESLESHDGTVTPVVHTMRGRITEVDQGTLKAGEVVPVKFTLNLTYYRLQHGGTVVQEIDLANMVHIVNGVDQLAAQRAALGL